MNLDVNQMKIKFDGEFRIRIFWKLSIKFLNVKSQASNFSRVKISWKLNFLLFEEVLS